MKGSGLGSHTLLLTCAIFSRGGRSLAAAGVRRRGRRCGAGELVLHPATAERGAARNLGAIPGLRLGIRRKAGTDLLVADPAFTYVRATGVLRHGGSGRRGVAAGPDAREAGGGRGGVAADRWREQ